jgi:hypothetical protein
MPGIQLKTQHLLIAADIAAEVFGAAAQAFTVYYPQQRALLLAPMDDEIFPQVHKAQLQMLKSRNLSGDKSMSLQEIIIDHDIDEADRELEYVFQPGMRMLKITL